MEGGALSETEFAEFAKNVVLFCHITTKIDGRKDDGLLSTVGGRGFPHIVAMDATGKIYGSPAGRKVAQFGEHMTLVKEYLDLKPKAEKGDAVAKVEFFIRAMMMGDYKDLSSAAKHLKTLSKVTPEQKTRIDEQFIGLEVQDLLQPVRDNKDQSKFQELSAAAGKTFLAMHKKGRVPKSDNLFGAFYSGIMDHAEVEKDPVVFEEALKLLEERYPDGNKRWFDAKRQTLERLQEEKAEKK